MTATNKHVQLFCKHYLYLWWLLLRRRLVKWRILKPYHQALRATTEDITVYVAGDGRDHWSGTIEELPVYTLQKALDNIPTVIRHPVTITIGKGTSLTDGERRKDN